jgi:hypothetical protein
MSTEMEKLKQLVNILNGDGHSATLEYPGFVCVVTDKETHLNFGFVNGPLGYDQCTLEGEYIDNLGIEESTLTVDAPIEAMAEYVLMVCRKVETS